MHATGYLSIELCRECNLGTLHKRCPNMHPDRYRWVFRGHELTDDVIVSVAERMYHRHGFQGMVAWHFYCEPLSEQGRMFRLMEQIKDTTPEARFCLWSNGTLLPKDCTPFKAFEQIHITDYQLPEHRAANLSALKKACPHTVVHRWKLDDRLNVLADEQSYAPCHRMFTEFIIDYYGNVHLCCYDWRGLASIGNVHKMRLGDLVAKWQFVREQIGGRVMEADSPGACLRCKMRSAGITEFVAEPAKAARGMARGWK